MTDENEKKDEIQLEGERKAANKYIQRIISEINISATYKGKSKNYWEGYKEGLRKSKEIIQDITL